jgi:opacity protein-like surface antigen
MILARFSRTALAVATLTMVAPAYASDPAAPSNAELYQIIQSLQTEVKALRKELDAERAKSAVPATNEQLSKQVEAQQQQIEALAAQVEAAPTASASAVTFGGYGELHYTNLNAEDSSNDVRMMDLHRFVLFTGYKFNDQLRFASEFEVEHAVASADDEGEVEIEQAFLEYDVNDRITTRGGVMLVPAGIINETHEPPTFYGVERNDVENVIIPATWWAGGVGATVRLMPTLQWDFMAHEGLKVPVTGGSAFAVRSGRQKTSEADASNLAYTTRLRYNGIPGLEVAGSLQYQTDVSQEGGDGLSDALLYTAHVVWERGPFAVRALWAGWSLSGDAAQLADADEQSGWYIEPSWKPVPSIGLYVRYEDIEGARLQDRFSEWEAGVSYFLHPQVVLKADYRTREQDLASEKGREFDGFDLGIGYQF